MKNLKLFSGASALAASAFSAVLLMGMGTQAEAQYSHACLNISGTLTNCPNVTIARNATMPYQMDARTKVRKVLLYDKNAAHNAGKQAIRRAMIWAANRYGFELVITDAAIGYITTTTLAGVNVVIFSQGDEDVTNANKGNGSASDIALQTYIYQQGGSMLMMHAASAFITCDGPNTGGGGANIAHPDCRFMARATARQYYHHQDAGSQMRVYADSTFAGQTPPWASLGGTAAQPPVSVMNHGRVNDETRNIFNNAAEYNWPLPKDNINDAAVTFGWENVPDEHYEYYNSPGPRAIPAMQRTFNGTQYTEGRLNILLALDERSRNIGSQRMGDHPASWVRKMGNGLAAYNNLGHDQQPYNNIRTGSGYATTDSMPTKYLWNLVRFLSRDYQGCTIPTASGYVPWATVTSITPTDTTGGINSCGPTAIAITPSTSASMGVSAFKGGIRISTPDAGFYKVYVTKLNGEYVGSRTILGGAGKKVEMDELNNGAYVVQVTTPQKRVNTARVVL